MESWAEEPSRQKLSDVAILWTLSGSPDDRVVMPSSAVLGGVDIIYFLLSVQIKFSNLWQLQFFSLMPTRERHRIQ